MGLSSVPPPPHVNVPRCHPNSCANSNEIFGKSVDDQMESLSPSLSTSFVAQYTTEEPYAPNSDDTKCAVPFNQIKSIIENNFTDQDASPIMSLEQPNSTAISYTNIESMVEDNGSVDSQAVGVVSAVGILTNSDPDSKAGDNTKKGLLIFTLVFRK